MCQDFHDESEWDALLAKTGVERRKSMLTRMSEIGARLMVLKQKCLAQISAEEFGSDVDDIAGAMKSDNAAKSRKRKTMKQLKSRKKGKRRKK